MKTDRLTFYDLIAIIALAAPVLRYAVAFQAAEPPLHIFGWDGNISLLTGLAFGVSYEAAAYIGMRAAFDARKRTVKRWYWPLVGALVQVAFGIAIVAPVLVAELRTTALDALLGHRFDWLWSAIVQAATLLSFATISLAIAMRKEQRTTSERQRTGSDTYIAHCDFPGCSWEKGGYRSERAASNARNAHKRKHREVVG